MWCDSQKQSTMQDIGQRRYETYRIHHGYLHHHQRAFNSMEKKINSFRKNTRDESPDSLLGETANTSTLD